MSGEAGRPGSKAGTIPRGMIGGASRLQVPRNCRMQAAHRVHVDSRERDHPIIFHDVWTRGRKQGIRPPALTATGSLPKGLTAPGECTPFQVP